MTTTIAADLAIADNGWRSNVAVTIRTNDGHSGHGNGHAHGE